MVLELRFCNFCAGRLAHQVINGRQIPYCSSCGAILYQDPKLVAVALLEHDGAIMMVRRNTEPGMGLWALPGGYVDRGEVVESAACRETLEETGLVVEVERLLGVHSEEGSPVVMIAYTVTFKGGDLRVASEEIQEVGFFPLGSLPPLAFPRDEQIIRSSCEDRTIQQDV